jgi:TRAP transporter TAXI family solute receptor
VLGTATPGGGFPAYGGAFAEAVHAADPSLEIVTQNTSGSTENVPLLEASLLDIALVQGEVAMLALEGIGRPPADLAVLTAMYATPGMFVVRADSPARSIADLKGQRVVFGARGSGLGILAQYVLDGMGFDRDRDFDAVFLDRAGDGPPMVLSGEAAALWGGGTGWPGFTAVAKGPQGARFIVPSGEEIARIQAKHSFLKTLQVPAGSFPGQSEALTSVGSWSLILARPSLDATIAYRLARALYEAEADLGQRLPQARETTAANTVAAVAPERLHPGVARYYRDIRLLN